MNTKGEIQEISAFTRFDVVSDSSDHYYVNSNVPKRNAVDPFANASGGSHKKIMQEWKILEKHLPESIFVRVYENRIDLLRAVIVGAAGTPYHDGLFFFDIVFPTDYPARPPCVYYRSFGLRLNPNLYANGRVCLSLLNTWTGKKCEKWNPQESTVLQVLISIQALVLNEKPYFNEPGHGMWPGRNIWEKKSSAYNEDVFVLSCKTMIFVLRKPPKNFEGFVSGHFRERGHVILSACKNYIQGHVRVGYFRNDESFCSPSSGSGSGSGSGSSSSAFVEVSEKFKGLMVQLYPELVTAFSRTGANLGNLVEQIKVEKRTTSLKGEVSVMNKKKKEKNKNGIASRVFGKIKGVLGLKKSVVKAR
ncbi:hypothetical protein Pint_24328 [Pistacia integerrima]|uniref:Uncharacterized protein n=1 Tax=Pistacia integerrima TaxID=434235 RepID=A0ACC0YFH0_9ROSI|nr:hypothetical protein Pint_24328 [Pistacia integerrima]